MYNNTVALVVALTFLGCTSPAEADEKSFAHWSCQDVGSPSAMENLGDRENHAVQVSTYTCVGETGPMKGAIITGTNIVEWDGPTANIISGQGVARTPGSIVVFRSIEGKLTLDMSDGKVIGWHGEGKNAELVGSGVGAQMVGKTASWTAKATGPGRFVVDE